MRLSALIHCRTFSFDFNPEFLVRPSDFTSDDIKWARERILSTTSYCDELVGKRYVIFNNNRYCIFGIVSLLDDALRMFEFPEHDIEKYSFDENKRKIKCFFGFVLHVSDKQIGMLPETDKNDYYNLLDRFVVDNDIFFCKKQIGIQVDYCFEKDLREAVNDKNADLYCISSEKNDAEMFERLLAEVSSRTNISFCSNVYNLKMIEDGKYNYFTSNQNTIQRFVIKKEEDRKKAEEAMLQEKREKQNNREESKKKDGQRAVFVIGVAVVLVVIILIIL